MYVNIKLSQFVWNIFWGKGVDLKPQNCKKKKTRQDDKKYN